MIFALGLCSCAIFEAADCIDSVNNDARRVHEWSFQSASSINSSKLQSIVLDVKLPIFAKACCGMKLNTYFKNVIHLRITINDIFT